MANNQQIIELKQEMNICNDKIDEKHLKLQALEKQIRETSEQYRGKMDQARWIFKEEIEELDLNDYWESITIKVSKNGQVNFYPFKNASRRTKSHGHIILNHRGELIYRRDLGQSHGKQNFIK
jgi:flagellar biosynthesis/type III secretory pathway chaperone